MFLFLLNQLLRFEHNVHSLFQCSETIVNRYDIIYLSNVHDRGKLQQITINIIIITGTRWETSYDCSVTLYDYGFWFSALQNNM